MRVDKDGKKAKANIWLSYLRSYEASRGRGRGEGRGWAAEAGLWAAERGGESERGRPAGHGVASAAGAAAPRPSGHRPGAPEACLLAFTAPPRRPPHACAAHGRGACRVPLRLLLRRQPPGRQLEPPGVAAADTHVQGKRVGGLASSSLGIAAPSRQRGAPMRARQVPTAQPAVAQPPLPARPPSPCPPAAGIAARQVRDSGDDCGREGGGGVRRAQGGGCDALQGPSTAAGRPSLLSGAPARQPRLLCAELPSPTNPCPPSSGPSLPCRPR